MWGFGNEKSFNLVVDVEIHLTHREDFPSGAGLDGELAEEPPLLGELAGADQLPDEVNLRHRPLRDIAFISDSGMRVFWSEP